MGLAERDSFVSLMNKPRASAALWPNSSTLSTSSVDRAGDPHLLPRVTLDHLSAKSWLPLLLLRCHSSQSLAFRLAWNRLATPLRCRLSRGRLARLRAGRPSLPAPPCFPLEVQRPNNICFPLEVRRLFHRFLLPHTLLPLRLPLSSRGLPLRLSLFGLPMWCAAS